MLSSKINYNFNFQNIFIIFSQYFHNIFTNYQHLCRWQNGLVSKLHKSIGKTTKYDNNNTKHD